MNKMTAMLEYTVAPPLNIFHTMILILFYINLGIAVIFYLFFLQKFSKNNKRSPMFIPESRVLRFLCLHTFQRPCHLLILYSFLFRQTLQKIVKTFISTSAIKQNFSRAYIRRSIPISSFKWLFGKL